MEIEGIKGFASSHHLAEHPGKYILVYDAEPPSDCEPVIIITPAQLAARDKELAAANVEAGALQARTEITAMLNKTFAEEATEEQLLGLNYALKALAEFPLPTTTLDALVKEERAKVLEKAANKCDESCTCHLYVDEDTEPPSCENCLNARAIRALAEEG